jgi:MFS family permease
VTATSPALSAGVVRTFRETPRPVRVLIFGMFVNRLGAFLHPFLVLYLLSIGIEPTRIGVAVGMLGAGGIVGGLAGGWCVDRFGPRRTIVIGSLGAGAATAGILYAPGFLGVLACTFLIGALGQAYRPASAALIAAHIPQARYTMVFAMYRLASNLGTTGGPLLAAALISISYTALFWVEATVLGLFALMAQRLLPVDRSPAAPTATSATTGSAVRVLLADRRYLLFLVSVLLVSAVYVQYLVGLPLQADAQGLPVWIYGVIIAVNGAIVTAFELPITRYTQRWEPRSAFTLNIILIGLGMSLYALPLGVTILIIGTVIWSTGEIIGAPAMFSYPAHVAPQRLRGRYLGVFNAAIGIAFAAGPALGALLWVVAGTGLWIICGLACFLAAVLAHTSMRRIHDRPDAANDRLITEPRPPQDTA